MPFGQKEKLKLEDVVDGMTAEQLKESLQAGKDAKEELTKVNNTLGTLAETLKRIEEKAAAPTSVEKKEKEIVEIPSVVDDEDGAFNARMAPLMGATLVTRSHQIYSDVRDKITRKQQKDLGYSDFELFEDEIKEELKKSPIQSQCNSQYVENVYSVVRGRHTEEILRDNAKRSGKYFIEGATNTGGGNIDKGSKEPVLTDDEKKYAEKFGITPEEFIKSKGSLKYV